jgi:uncharacterized lipoprotein YehR (DUF1307 family)
MEEKAMKRTLAIILTLVMIAMLLTACGGSGLSGTYVPESGSVAAYSELKFSGSKITLKMAGASYTASYTFKDDTLSFKIKELNVAGMDLGDISLPCTLDGDTLTFGGTKYVKQ